MVDKTWSMYEIGNSVLYLTNINVLFLRVENISIAQMQHGLKIVLVFLSDGRYSHFQRNKIFQLVSTKTTVKCFYGVYIAKTVRIWDSLLVLFSLISGKWWWTYAQQTQHGKSTYNVWQWNLEKTVWCQGCSTELGGLGALWSFSSFLAL